MFKSIEKFSGYEGTKSSVGSLFEDIQILPIAYGVMIVGRGEVVGSGLQESWVGRGGRGSGTTNLRNEISNFQQRFDELFHEAWDRYKDFLRACPHHGFTKLHQLDTFYNALNSADQDSLNSAAGGNLLERRTQDVLTIIENKSKCLAAGGNIFPELRDHIQGYVAAAAVNYNQGNSSYRPLGSGSLPSNTIGNSKGELKAIITRSGIVLDGHSVPISPLFINLEEDERVKETLTDQYLAEYTIKVPPPLFQKSKPPSQRNFVVQQRDPLHPNIHYPSRMYKQKQHEKDEEKLLELANSPLYENCSAVILKKLLEKLRDPRKILIPCGFSELKCKSLADLANRAICTPAGIARDVFVPVGKFTFPNDFVIVDFERDLRVPLILGRPFLQTARALIDFHGEEMVLRDGDERLTLNIRHDTSSYSNQPKKESINMINIYDDSSEDFLENLFSTNHQSGNPTFSSHLNLTSPKVKNDVFDPEGGNVLIEKLLDLDSTKDLHPPHHINLLSGSTTSSSPNHLLEEFTDELALITFSSGNDDLTFDIESDLKEREYLLHHDPIKDMDFGLKDSINQSNLANLNDNLADIMPEMFTDEHALD
uniref:Reverse transcriptase domain-containing protein n=1 Tax=Tanacetum cinerariifolium TaxID=118510 RepID=A0A6L2MQJ7_TANCI|nr:hypothetical protein [Tanacetum cinerariifolium]